jgi:hypothetical protein
VVLPALVSKGDNSDSPASRISTKKFVRLNQKKEPVITLKVFKFQIMNFKNLKIQTISL